MTRLEELKEIVKPCGVFIDTYSPGDGVRYRFLTKDVDYFADDGIYTCVGFEKAKIFAKGLFWGYAIRDTK